MMSNPSYAAEFAKGHGTRKSKHAWEKTTWLACRKPGEIVQGKFLLGEGIHSYTGPVSLH